MRKKINTDSKGLDPIFLTKIGISFAPNSNTIKTNNEKIGICKVSSPKMIIINKRGTPNKLINTLEDFLSVIIQYNKKGNLQTKI